MKIIKVTLWLSLGLAIAIILLFAFLSYSTHLDIAKPADNRQLQDCPTTPNCVSSLAQRESQQAAPLRSNTAITNEQWDHVVKLLRQLGGDILVNDGNYCHAVFRSRVFQFKDDVELVRGETEIHLRSASRAGRSDLGVNRERVENLHALWRQDPGHE